MPHVLTRPMHYLLLLALIASSMVFSAAPAWACHFSSATAATSTADGFTFEARWTTSANGNTGIGVDSATAGTVTWWLIDSYPDGTEITQEPSSHGDGQGVRFVVTGLQPDQSSSVTVSAYLGSAGNCTGDMTSKRSRMVTGSALMATGMAPLISDVARTADGFTATITNFDADATYSLSTSQGVVSRTGDTLTVSGLAPASDATVTVQVAKAGHTTVSDSVTGTSLTTGMAPLFSDVARTADGFTATITNFDADATYSLSTSQGVVSRTGDTLTVSGLAPASDATVTVQVAKAGHTTVSDSVTGTSWATGMAPLFSDVARTADGFTATITNFDADATYSLSTSQGVVSRTGDTLTVSGLAPASDATVTVQVAKAGHTTVSDSVTGTSKPVPTMMATGELPQLAPSDTFVLLDGQAHSVRLLTTDDSVQIEGDGFSLTLTAMEPNGEAASLTPGGHLRLELGQHAHVRGEGFAAGTRVAVWLFSTPILLGELDVQSDGTFEGLLPISVDIEPGEHTLQANGVTDDGTMMSASIGVFVDAEEEVTPLPAPEPEATSDVLPTTGGSLQGLSALALGLLLIGLLGLKLTRRRPTM